MAGAGDVRPSVNSGRRKNPRKFFLAPRIAKEVLMNLALLGRVGWQVLRKQRWVAGWRVALGGRGSKDVERCPHEKGGVGRLYLFKTDGQRDGRWRRVAIAPKMVKTFRLTGFIWDLGISECL